MKTVPALWLGEIIGYIDLTEEQAWSLPPKLRTYVVNHQVPDE